MKKESQEEPKGCGKEFVTDNNDGYKNYCKEGNLCPSCKKLSKSPDKKTDKHSQYSVGSHKVYQSNSTKREKGTDKQDNSAGDTSKSSDNGKKVLQDKDVSDVTTKDTAVKTLSAVSNLQDETDLTWYNVKEDIVHKEDCIILYLRKEISKTCKEAKGEKE